MINMLSMLSKVNAMNMNDDDNNKQEFCKMNEFNMGKLLIKYYIRW